MTALEGIDKNGKLCYDASTMYIRSHTIKGRHGQVYTYLELIYTERRNGKVRQERICSLGRVEELQKRGAIDRMIAKLSTAARHRWVQAEALKLGTPWVKEYGSVLLMRRLWRNLGLEDIIAGLYQPNSAKVSVGEALLALVVSVMTTPRSELGSYSWLKEKVYALEWDGLELHHLYRSLDFLAEHMGTIEESGRQGAGVTW
jgi:hypothetical protein